MATRKWLRLEDGDTQDKRYSKHHTKERIMHLQKKAFWERGWHMVTEYTLHKLYAKSLFRTDSKSALNTAL